MSKSLGPTKEACKSIKLSGAMVEHVWVNLLASQIQDILNNRGAQQAAPHRRWRNGEAANP
jgi:hypothetical protein